MRICKHSFRTLRITTLLTVLFSTSYLWAQTEDAKGNDVVTNAQMLSFGSTNVLDTYLAPVNYTGAEIRYISHTTRQTPGSHYSRQLVHQGYVADVEDHSGKGSEISGLYDFSFAIHYNWSFLNDRLRVQVGGQMETGIGVINNTRNSNNPAQLRLFANIAPSVVTTYRFQLFKKRLSARYELSVPLAGLMFSPNYGQSYYEIFSRGNYDHNCVLTTLANAPSLRHALTLDMSLWGTTFRIGYLGDYQQAKVNHLKQHNYTHGLMIGFVRKFSIVKVEDH